MRTNKERMRRAVTALKAKVVRRVVKHGSAPSPRPRGCRKRATASPSASSPGAASGCAWTTWCRTTTACWRSCRPGSSSSGVTERTRSGVTERTLPRPNTKRQAGAASKKPPRKPRGPKPPFILPGLQVVSTESTTTCRAGCLTIFNDSSKCSSVCVCLSAFNCGPRARRGGARARGRPRRQRQPAGRDGRGGVGGASSAPRWRSAPGGRPPPTRDPSLVRWPKLQGRPRGPGSRVARHELPKAKPRGGPAVRAPPTWGGGA